MSDILFWASAGYLWLGGSWWMYGTLGDADRLLDVAVNYLVCVVFWPVALVARLIKKGLGIWQ